MMMQPATLQDFDAVAKADDSVPEVSAEFEAGREQGIIEGRALAMQDATLLRATAVQALGDMQFGYAEARAHFLAQLGPLFEVLANRLLPDMARAALPVHIAGILSAAAQADATTPVDVAVHPENLGALEALVSEAVGGVPVRVVADPDLGLGQAQICKADGQGTALDVDAVLHDMRAALAALFDTPDERTA